MIRSLVSMSAVVLLLSTVACTEPETEVDSTTIVESETVAPVPTPTTTATEADLTGESFVEEAATNGMSEVRLGEMAQQNAQSSEVRDFGQMMVDDHQQANEELATIAENLNMTMPSSLTTEQQQKVDRLEGLSGAEFDREYASMMVEDHEKAVDLFERASNGDLPQELQQYASETLPTLEDHLERAEELQSQTGQS